MYIRTHQDEEEEAAAAAEADGGVEGERSHRRRDPSALPVKRCSVLQWVAVCCSVALNTR